MAADGRSDEQAALLQVAASSGGARQSIGRRPADRGRTDGRAIGGQPQAATATDKRAHCLRAGGRSVGRGAGELRAALQRLCWACGLLRLPARRRGMAG
jgi:hypothetical protein